MTPKEDDINYWEVSRDGSGGGFVDYNLNITPQNWNKFSTLTMRYTAFCLNGCNGNNGIVVYIHDADGTGNSDGNGYHNLGFYSTSNVVDLALNISNVPNRDQIDQIKIRVDSGFFSNSSQIGAFQRTHLYDIKVSGAISFPTISSHTNAGTVIVHDSHDYGPAIINDNGTFKMWWCGINAPANTADGIWYATSTNGQNWSSPKLVLTAENTTESYNKPAGHACDPSVVKVNNTYYMYYTATGVELPNNQIFLATSTNGTTWTKYRGNDGKPIAVIPNVVNGTQYGIGQSSVLYINGIFYHYYTNTYRGGTLLAISYDGRNWYDAGTRNPVQNHDGNPVFPQFTTAVTYLWQYNTFVAFRADIDDLRYVFSSDGKNWQSENDTQRIVTGPGYIHNVGILTNQDGTLTGTGLNTYYGAGPNDTSYLWNIDRTYMFFSP
jgi:predicted GH43/DUF377 family glycosyl hydrolase